MRLLAIAFALAVLFPVTRGEAAMMREWVLVVGSSTLYPLAVVAAERLSRTTDHRAPVVEASGTGGGFDRFCADDDLSTPDIVNASRRIRESERRRCREAGVDDIVEIPIGFDGIVAIRSNTATPLAITHEQLWTAIAETVPVLGRPMANPFTRWSGIDPALPDEPIRIYGPPMTSGTRDTIAEKVMQRSCDELEPATAGTPEGRAACRRVRIDGPYIAVMESDDLVVRRTHDDPFAVGLIGFNTYFRFDTMLHTVPIDGIEPTYDSIHERTYPLTRTLYVYVKKSRIGKVDGLHAFLTALTDDSAIGPEGYLVDQGLVPLNDAARAEARATVRDLAPAR